MRRLVLGVMVALALPGPATAGTCDSPEAHWLACEDFEDAGQGWEGWYAASPFVGCVGCSGGLNDPARILLRDDPAQAHEGRFSLHMPAEASAGYRGGSLVWRSCAGTKRGGCTLTNHEALWFRTWVRLAEDHAYVHHFLSVGGTRPDAYWEGDGNAGCRPNGYRAAGTTVDFNRQHELFFYTYFPDMHCDAGGYCSGTYAQGICDGCATKEMACTGTLECCWGNLFSTPPRPVLPRGPWVCLEMMMRLNTPGQADGEMAYWMDGVLGHRQTGMHWRDVPELGLNKASLQHYIDTGDATQSNRIWFDDVVVATAPIGCGEGGGTDGGTPPPDAGIPEDAGAAQDAAIASDAGSTDSGGLDAAAPGDGGAPAADGGAPAADGGAARDASPGIDDDSYTGTGGCGCTSAPPASGAALLALLGLGLMPRRRRLTRPGAPANPRG